MHQFKSSISENVKRIRVTSKASYTALSRIWFLQWITNKSFFKKIIKKLENCFSKLISRQLNENSLIATVNSIIRQSKHISDINMTVITKFLAINNNSSSSNQTENDKIIVIVIRIFESYFRNKKLSNAFNSFISNANFISNSSNETRNFIKKWIYEDVDFFDFSYKDNSFIINVDKHVFYRDIYTFINRLKDMTIHRTFDKIKNFISQCFRKSALIWHSAELSDLEKKMLRKTSLTMWYNALIKRFKQRISIVLINIQFWIF